MTVYDSPTAPDHLYTWLDVDQYLSQLAEYGEWPPWLVEIDAYWDGVRLAVTPGTREGTVWAWLHGVLGPLTAVAAKRLIMLDDTGTERTLPVEIDFAVPPPPAERRPRWADHRIVASLAEPLPHPEPDRLPHEVAIVGFHSFKGGAGRTLHCVAVARELARTGIGVMLVDADLEAPGITWMVSDAMRVDFAFEDFLALVHGSTDQRYEDAISLGRKFLANQELDGVIVMPARRDYQRIAPPRIRPDDLLTPRRSPYVLTQVLSELGHSMGAQVVLVDLRAGASELSAPLLLDPRVHRVVVTTTSDQAVRGSKQLLNQLARRAPARRLSDPDCLVLVTQFSPQDHREVLAEIAADLQDAAFRVSRGPAYQATVADGSAVDLDAASSLLYSPFDPWLLSLPAGWGDVLQLAARPNIAEAVRPLVDLLGATQAPPHEPHTSTPSTGDRVDDRRRRLTETARRLVYAEISADGRFLSTEALRGLVEAHRTEVPIEVVMGGKGSGKTFTHLQLCDSRSWRRFADAAKVPGVSVAAPTVPVLASTTLSGPRRAALDAWLVEAAAQLSGRSPAGLLGIRDLVREGLGRDVDDLGWRRIWLTCLARSIGLRATPGDADVVLADFAREHQAIFVLDGLEDLFQDFTTDRNQHRALRGLLIDCPDWLRTLRGRPLGLVIFVRRDLAQAALPQNFAQFAMRHEKYSLRWNHDEALRLAAWVCQQARAIAGSGEHIRRANRKELSEMLFAVWGDKMGSPKSKEAGSQRWFFAALSDFNQQIQARDIVSFLAEAAEESIGDARWAERLLTPAAMRTALAACSRQKIDAINEENKPVGTLLRRLGGLEAERRRVPFKLPDLSLSLEEAQLLELNGVLFREGNQYWIPEIYRHGLGFSASGRPRVLAVANLVRGRNDPG